MPRKVQAVNPDAAVTPTLPDGAVEHAAYQPLGFREAFDSRTGRHYHYCPDCGGWVGGSAVYARENTLGPLSGRNGSSYSCRRCGTELAFVGMVS